MALPVLNVSEIASVGSSVPAMMWVWRLCVLGVILGFVWYAGKEWVNYIRMQYIATLKWKLLYIKLPRTAPRSIETMEMIFNVLWQTGKTGDWVALWWKGQVRPYHTLEMVSIEGKIFFFIRTYEEFVPFLKSQIYAQYPECEITEVDDYVGFVPKYVAGKCDWDIHGYELELEKDDLYPIKTYVDWGLDRAGKAEERIDPLANVLELMASIGPGEQYWVQFHIRAATNRYAKGGDAYLKQSWQDQNKGILGKFEEAFQKEMLARSGKTEKFGELYPELSKKIPYEYMTKYHKDIYDALERHIVKNAFDVGIRCLYIAQKDVFRPAIHNGMGQVWRIFTAPGMNGLKPIGSNNTIAFDYDWDNAFSLPANKRKDNLYQAYIARSYFYPPYDEYLDETKRKQMILTTEEIATLFHFPGAEVTTGSLSRVESRKVEPPRNLPIL